jgi:alpha-1,6-mannosyltransferase
MSACDTFDATGRAPTIPLRFGLDPAFRPPADLEHGDHVLYAGRISADKGLFTLLAAMALSRGEWTLRLVGDGPALPEVSERARKLGIQHRIEHRSFIDDRHELAREYATAACVVVPGAHESFGLVALEAAACGAPVVATATTPSVSLIGEAAHTFPGGDVRELLQALGRARLAPHDGARGEALAQAHTWDHAFRQELRDLKALARW